MLNYLMLYLIILNKLIKYNLLDVTHHTEVVVYFDLIKNRVLVSLTGAAKSPFYSLKKNVFAISTLHLVKNV